jgi:hypothetical protein
MRLTPPLAALPLLLASLAAAPATAPAVKPLVNAHAHNDYEHPRPLLDALDAGFCSVEADVFLVNGRLLVAHNLPDVRPQRTLQALYLDPLKQRVAAHAGRVYRDGPEFFLMVDIKSEAEATYAALREALAAYEPMLTSFRDGKLTRNAVTVIVSGSRPVRTMRNEPRRLAMLDGRLEDLRRGYPPELMPLISARWGDAFAWTGQGQMPPEQREALKALVDRVHGQGRRIRFWAIPDSAAGWGELRTAGVDLINTDKLQELRQFLSDTPPAR